MASSLIGVSLREVHVGDIDRLLLSNLILRLVAQGTGQYLLPGGMLSSLEVEVLRRLSGCQAQDAAVISQNGGGNSSTEAPAVPARIALVMDSFTRLGPPESELRLCLDFGTAMSKAWATGKDESETLPLILGQDSAGEPVLAVSSAVFIDDDGRIYIGEGAERQFRSHGGATRRIYNNIKRLLSNAEIGSDLHAGRLEIEINPTTSDISKGDLLVLYLAWLTDRGLVALLDAIVLGEISLPDGAHVRGVKRRFAIPCFEDTHNDGHGRRRAEWARRTMRQALMRAQVLADTLAGRWDDLHVSQLAEIMRELRGVDVAGLEHLFATSPEVREPVAAGASRFSSRLDAHSDGSVIRHALLVVDAGAGTTDFAMFQVAAGAGQAPRYALVRNSVRMSTVAGNTADMELKSLCLRACGIDPISGAPRAPDEFAFIRADLDARVREFKRLLVTSGTLDVGLALNTTGRVLLADFVAAMQRHADELRAVRDTIVAGAFTHEVRSSVDQVRFMSEAYPVSVLLTGGSAALPAVAALAHGETSVDGFRVGFAPIEEMPDWIQELPAEVATAVSGAYPQCAVAIGGSAVALPNEIEDLKGLIMPPPRGPRTLTRTQVSGPVG